MPIQIRQPSIANACLQAQEGVPQKKGLEKVADADHINLQRPTRLLINANSERYPYDQGKAFTHPILLPSLYQKLHQPI